MRKCLALAVTVLIELAAVLGSPGTGFAQKGPIKAGLLVPQTGPLAANGKDMVNALQLFFGWEVAAGFQRTFEESGGEGVRKLWSPLNAADYGPYLTQVRRDADVVYTIFSGAEALRFVYSRVYPPRTHC
jgi:hypothetical protein